MTLLRLRLPIRLLCRTDRSARPRRRRPSVPREGPQKRSGRGSVHPSSHRCQRSRSYLGSDCTNLQCGQGCMFRCHGGRRLVGDPSEKGAVMASLTAKPRIGTATGASQDAEELFRCWKCDGDEHARELIAERYMPLARKLARRYGRSSEPFEDLAQVATMGLLKAMDRYDPQRGAFQSF